MSWFQSLQSATDAITKIGGEISNKVQEALPVDSVDLINKLTLRTDELLQEHELIDAQEKRKELVREYLSEILPWETKDESRAILVDQCQEAILKLSTKKVTFETPFLLQKGKMFLEDEDEDEEATEEGNQITHEQIEASQLKLEKMQPLPFLLECFDIDTHVGLIERLLKVDKQLVYMHSMLSGAGEKETTFWKNYFFHCAYTRYKEGLSVDEIWSQKPKASITNDMNSVVSKASEASLQNDMMDDDESVELEFEEDEENSSILNESNQSHTLPATLATKTSSPNVVNSGQSVSSASGNSYEIVNEAPINNEDEDDDDDLDDLEAEIARELGED